MLRFPPFIIALLYIIIWEGYAQPTSIKNPIVLSTTSLTLDYRGTATIQVDPNIEWEIDKTSSTALSNVILLDPSGKEIMASNGNFDFYNIQLKDIKSTPFSNLTLVLKGKGDNAEKYQSTIQLTLSAPFLNITYKDDNKSISTEPNRDFWNEPRPSSDDPKFPSIPLIINTNIIWSAQITFTPNHAPWALFSYNSSQHLDRIITNRENLEILITELNYVTDPTKTLQATITFTPESPEYVRDGTKPNLPVQSFTITLHPLNAKVSEAMGQDYRYKASNLSNIPDTLYFPYYATNTQNGSCHETPAQMEENHTCNVDPCTLPNKGTLKITTDVGGNTAWDIFNEVNLRQAFGFNIKHGGTGGTDNKTACVQICHDNFSRQDRIGQLILFHTQGIIFNPPKIWEGPIIVQRAGYIDLPRDTVVIENPLPQQEVLRVPVESNIQWTASFNNGSNPDWLSFSTQRRQATNGINNTNATSITGDGTIIFNTLKLNNTNADKKVTLLVKNEYGPCRLLTIIQRPAYIRVVTPTQVIFPSNANGQGIFVRIDANVDWKVSESVDWLSIMDTTHNGFWIFANNNKTGQERMASLILESKDGQFVANGIHTNANYVKQIITSITLSVTPFPSIVFGAKAGEDASLNIFSNGGWVVETLPGQDYSWLSLPSTLSGVFDQTLTFHTIQNNGTHFLRKTILRIRSQLTSLDPFDLHIVQSGDFDITMNTLVSDQLNVIFSSFENGYKARVFNDLGVMAQEIFFTSERNVVDVSAIPTGNYLVYFYDKMGRVLAVRKMVKI